MNFIRSLSPFKTREQSAEITPIVNELSQFERFTTSDMASLLTYADVDFGSSTQSKSANIDQIIQIVHSKLKINGSNVDKIKEYSQTQTAVINYDTYKYIYVLSDVHSDFNSLFITLLQNNVIGLFQNSIKINDAEKIKIMTDIVTNYNVKEPNSRNPKYPFGKNKVDILKNILTMYDVKLIKANTLILVLGDIVDGRRTRSNDPRDEDSHIFEDVTNEYGLNELLIHILFYNMRIDSLGLNSNVMLELGNHEMMTIFDTTNPESYNNYVDLQTHLLFGSRAARRKILAPFYLFDSALFKLIVKNNKIVAYASHGSFAGFDRADNAKYKAFTIDEYNGIFNMCKNDITRMYETMGIIKTFDSKENLAKKSNLTITVSNFVWSRQFAEVLGKIDNPDTRPQQNCGIVDTFAQENSFVLMGHCVVSSYVDQSAFKSKIKKGYESCVDHSCIFAGCVKDNVPKIILVDNTISYANQEVNSGEASIPALDPRFPTSKKKHIADKTGRYIKFIEMLLLVKNNQSNNYNFIITRATFTKDDGTPDIRLDFKTLKKDNNVVLPDRIVTANPYQPADQMGGYQAKYLKYKGKSDALKQVI